MLHTYLLGKYKLSSENSFFLAVIVEVVLVCGFRTIT